jgi:hypothetical protein
VASLRTDRDPTTRSPERRARLDEILRAQGFAPTRLMLFHEQNDIDVARFIDGDRNCELIVKTGRTPRGDRGLQRHADALSSLVDRLGSVRELVPRLAHLGTHDSRTVVCETVRPGVPLWQLDRVRKRRAIEASLALAPHIHAAGQSHERPTPADLARWIDRPLAEIRTHDPDGALDASATRLAAHLHEVLDRPLRIAHVHGDFSSHNILVSVTGRVTGLVDWEAAQPRGLPDIDLLQFAMLMEPLAFSLGDLMVRSLRDGQVPEPTRALVTSVHARTPNGLALHDALTLVWLTQAGELLGKSERYAGAWYEHNVVPVLQTWARTAG